MFVKKNGDGQRKLRNVLRAFAVRNSTIGYCQGMGMVCGNYSFNMNDQVGMLLMHMSERDAFGCLVSICEDKTYLEGYFGDSLQQLQIDTVCFTNILASKMPLMHKKLVINLWIK